MRNSIIQSRVIEKIALALGELNEKVAFVVVQSSVFMQRIGHPKMCDRPKTLILPYKLFH
jgi:hypothetical protein